MGVNYDLYLLPADPSYLPSAETLRGLLGWLPGRLDVDDRWWPDSTSRLHGKHPPSTGEAALRRLLPVLETGKGSGEASLDLPLRVSTALFGWNGEDSDPDDRFWADNLDVGVDARAYPFIDWNGEDDPPSLRCPDCGAGVRDEVDAVLVDEQSSQERTVACICGTSTPLPRLEVSGRVRFARLWIALTGNKGWHRDVTDDVEAFADRAFLEELSKRIGAPLEVFCIVS